MGTWSLEWSEGDPAQCWIKLAQISKDFRSCLQCESWVCSGEEGELNTDFIEMLDLNDRIEAE